MSKPVALTSLNGVKPSFVELVNKHFSVVDVVDFERNSAEFAHDIKAIIQLFRKPVITKELLETLPNLKIVSHNGVGFDHLDVEMIRSFNVKISNSSGASSDSVADVGMLLLLAAGRDFLRALDLAKSPATINPFKHMMSMDVHSSTLGIVGMGRIGYAVARRAKAFNMKILYHNRNKRPVVDEEAVDATYYSDINDMLPLCDYVMVVVCLTPETKGMFGAPQFKKMKTSSVFINISRGDVVDQVALVNALSNGKIRSAALDVTTPEPLPKDHVLLTMPNVIVTPHMGWYSANTVTAMVQQAIDNALSAIEGRPLISEVAF